MKKIYNLAMLMALLFALHGSAQQIAVVSGGNTSVYQTLQAAIEGATNGSVIYLPGGGFTISDDVKITKRVTIIGIGHKANSDNVDGATVINGSLFFNKGSDGSAVMGCYTTGQICIANDGVVNNVTVRLCNVLSIDVNKEGCTGTFINQNYIRGDVSLGYSEATITNNVISPSSGGNKNQGYNCIESMKGGILKNNILARSGGYYYFNNSCNAMTITGNIFCNYISGYVGAVNDSQVSGNMCVGFSIGDDCIAINGININNIFLNYNGGAASPVSNFHFKDEYKQYESQVGIYAGTGFSDSALPPVPYIVAKKIDEQTDAAGKLKIRLRVNAGE